MTRYLRFDSNRLELASAITATAGAADANKLIAAASDGLINPALVTRASTTAGLGSGSVLGEIRLCTDCLTTIGEGGLVMWTGPAWRTLRDGIAPTTDYLTFFRSMVSEGTTRASSRVQFTFADTLFGANSAGIGTITSGSGTSAANVADVSIAHPGAGQISTGTAATGNAARGTNAAPLSGHWYSAWAICLPLLSSSVNEYACRLSIAAGLLGSTTSQYSDAGIHLIYDRVNATGGLAAGSDNWIIRYSAGTPEYTDTGIPVVAANSTFNFVEIFLSPTAHQIYWDGNLIFNRTSSLFSGATYSIAMAINKYVGTTARVFRFSWEAYGYYFPAAVNRFAN